MFLLRSFKVAFSALDAKKLRSTLAVLGIVIGVASVIAMIAMGRGAQAKVEESITTGLALPITVYVPGCVQNEMVCPLTTSLPPIPIEVGMVRTSVPFS